MGVMLTYSIGITIERMFGSLKFAVISLNFGRDRTHVHCAENLALELPTGFCIPGVNSGAHCTSLWIINRLKVRAC